MDGEKCVFFNRSGYRWECRILTDMQYCAGDACSSFKTKEMIEEQNRACLKRLKSLPPIQQYYIKTKYRGSILNRKGGTDDEL